MSRPSFRLGAYALVVFLSSALVLVLEIVAGRLIAPFVGVSLYSWTAIIGVVLAGLSLGNWLGGVWADRGGAERAAGSVLIAAAVSAFAILLILPRIAGPLQQSELSLAASSVVLAGALFFLPAVLLGVITPLLTTLALACSTRTGHIVGMMHALAALGSILGTFVTGFWLVQWIGSRSIIVSTGIVLLVLGLPLLGSGRAAAGSAFGVLIALALALSPAGYPDPCDRESSYFCLRVVDSSAEAPFGEARSLVLDHLMHGTNHREQPGLLLAPYLHLMDELARVQTHGRDDTRWFFAGGGAYTLPRAVRDRDPRAHITVAELDPVVTETAQQRLFFDAAGLNVMHQDARAALARDPETQYDVVIGDVFHDIAVPSHLLTREFAELVKAHLAADGLYVMNLVDAFPDGRLLKSVVKTLRQVFAEVDVWIEQLPQAPTRLTYVVSARDTGPELHDALRATSGMPRTWYRITEPAMQVGTPLGEIPTLSDELAPVERLLARLFLGREGR